MSSSSGPCCNDPYYVWSTGQFKISIENKHRSSRSNLGRNTSRVCVSVQSCLPKPLRILPIISIQVSHQIAFASSFPKDELVVALTFYCTKLPLGATVSARTSVCTPHSPISSLHRYLIASSRALLPLCFPFDRFSSDKVPIG